MTRIALTAAALAMAVLCASCSSRAGHGVDYPYCAVAGGFNSYENCGYASLQQCLAATSGVGGNCMPNPRFRPRQYDEGPPNRSYR